MSRDRNRIVTPYTDPDRFTLDGTARAGGAALLDQAWHIGWRFATAAIIAGKD